MQEVPSHGPVSQLLPYELLPPEGHFESHHFETAAGSLCAFTLLAILCEPGLTLCLIATLIKVMDQESFPLETQFF